jgi:uncharacterized protein (TIGR03435 family)
MLVARVLGIVACAIAISSGLLGQMLEGPAFEAASVKPHDGPMRRIGVTSAGSRLTADAQTPAGLIMFAYNVRNDQIVRTKPLLTIGDVFYDVVATAGGTPTRDEFRRMMQTLLADRFQLRIHREMKEMPVYALVVGKNGPKLSASTPDAKSMFHLSLQGRNYQHTMPKATMDDLVESILNSAGLDRPVLNQTGLTGTYDINLTYTPEFKLSNGPEDISIFTAVQEQLGLKLIQQRSAVEMLVVDEVQKPSAN